MIIILKKGVAIFYRRNTPDYTFLWRRKLWELSIKHSFDSDFHLASNDGHSFIKN